VRFESIGLEGPQLVHPEVFEDERGHFMRMFDVTEFAEHGLDARVAHMSVASNHVRGTVRGMHLQVRPHEEAKFVRCVRGRIQDVMVDVRAGSATCGQWCAVELSADDPVALFIPAGFAHGYITLEDDTDLEYLISAPYAPQASAGIRWDDPIIAIEWALPPVVVSSRDEAFPNVDLTLLRTQGPAALATS
jgi:dTDP-4-dehydrorhamnose 3,5-epimerase